MAFSPDIQQLTRKAEDVYNGYKSGVGRSPDGRFFYGEAWGQEIIGTTDGLNIRRTYSLVGCLDALGMVESPLYLTQEDHGTGQKIILWEAGTEGLVNDSVVRRALGIIEQESQERIDNGEEKIVEDLNKLPTIEGFLSSQPL